MRGIRFCYCKTRSPSPSHCFAMGPALAPMGRGIYGSRNSVLFSGPQCGKAALQSGHGVTDEIAGAGGDRRRRGDGSGAALSFGAGRLERYRAHRKGRADLGLDLACGGAMSAFQRLAQHDEGACLWHGALSEARGAHRASGVVARLRGPQAGGDRRGSELVQICLWHLAAGRLRVRDHRTFRD